MKYIYVMENIMNHKKYIGQTNNFQKRMISHKSDANNPQSHSYDYPLSNAIRKYGWDNFNNYIIEEIPEEAGQEYINERERFFIQYYNSLSNQEGYNICLGGAGHPREKKTYEEKLQDSKLFSAMEIKDIQNRLRNNETFKSILELYSPRLTHSFLSNINIGLNFKNDKWNYPLKTKKDLSTKFTLEEIHAIKQDIISGTKYTEIASKWNISSGMISTINNGKQWYEDEYQYPLCIKGHSRLHNLNTWVKDVQQDLMNGTETMTSIAKKYNKAYSTIKKINSGSSHRNANYKYPLTSNRT